ncbi:hypothetical protein ACX1I0_12080 [Yersinia enterocolitica]
MDGSFWGALIAAFIGAVIALTAVFITAKKTYEYNKKLENDKLATAKREELFITCELVKKSLAANELTILKVVASAQSVNFTEKYDTSKAHPFHVMKMIINMYLPEFKIDLAVLLENHSEFHKYYNKYATPHVFSKFTQEEKNKYISDTEKLAKEIYQRIEIIQSKLAK